MTIWHRFFFGFLAMIIIASSYPLSIFWNMGLKGIIWLKNDPAYSCFVLLLLPLAVGIFFAIFDQNKILKLPLFIKFYAFTAIIISQIITMGVTLDDARSTRMIPPFLLKDFDQALELDQEIRARIPSQRERMFETNYLIKDLGSEYMKDIKPFHSLSDRLNRGSLTAIISVTISLISGLFVVFVFWYILILIYWRSISGNANSIESPPSVNDCEIYMILLIISLTIFWFPMRMYSDWYQKFYSLEIYKSYYLFVLLVILVTFSSIGIIILQIPDKLVKIIYYIVCFLSVLCGIVARVFPEALWVFWGIAESTSFWGYAVFVWLLFNFFGVIVVSKINSFHATQRRRQIPDQPAR